MNILNNPSNVTSIATHSALGQWVNQTTNVTAHSNLRGGDFPLLDSTSRGLMLENCENACLLDIENDEDASPILLSCYQGDCTVTTPVERVAITLHCTGDSGNSFSQLSGIKVGSGLSMSGAGGSVRVVAGDRSEIEGACKEGKAFESEEDAPSSSAANRLPSAGACMRTLVVASFLLLAQY